MREYKVGDIINVLPGTELDQGLHEDAEPVRVDAVEQVVVLTPLIDGAYAVYLVQYPNLIPLYWHQPETRVV